MTTKQWLNRARVLAAERDKMLAEGPGADAEAARAAADKKVCEWALVKAEIVNNVYKLTDRQERIVLLNYYCNRMTVREIVEDMNVTIKTAFCIKRSAIRHLGEVLGLG